MKQRIMRILFSAEKLMFLFLLTVYDDKQKFSTGFIVLSPAVTTPWFGSRLSTSRLFYHQGSNVTSDLSLVEAERLQRHLTGDSINDNNNNISSYNHRFVRVAPNGAQITMVGSGPGSPDLLTVAAYRLLTSKDNNSGNKQKLIIADRLVSSDVLDICEGEVRVARKHPGCAEQAQEDIYLWVKEGVKDGRHVIRLKIGDPFVFGRGGEEVLRFRSMCGIEPTVIPGVSAALSAPLLGGIPITHRGVSNQVVICTGYGKDGSSPDILKYHREQTVVFLMAVGRLQELMGKLQTIGEYPPIIPVAIVERAGCADKQRTIVGTVSNIASIADKHHVQAPSTIIVGNVVRVLLTNDFDKLSCNFDDQEVWNGVTFHELLLPTLQV